MFARNGYAILACALSLSAPLASATETPTENSRVAVVYVQPERFKDVGDRYYPRDAARQAYLDDLRKHLQQRAGARVPEGQRLTVRITEIDMAGGFEPWRGHLGQVRIVRDVYPPRIDLDFTLTTADGTLVQTGERQLRDLAYLGRPGLYRGSDPLRYEKTLLDDWLEREFATLRPTS